MADRYVGMEGGRAHFVGEKWWWDQHLREPTNRYSMDERECEARRQLAHDMARGTEPFDLALLDLRSAPPAGDVPRPTPAAARQDVIAEAVALSRSHRSATECICHLCKAVAVLESVSGITVAQ